MSSLPPTKLGCHADREFQVTQTDEFCADPWVCKVGGQKPRLNKRVHYRLALHTVGYGLKDFKGTAELLQATYDVLQGCRLLHLITSLH